MAVSDGTGRPRVRNWMRALRRHGDRPHAATIEADEWDLGEGTRVITGDLPSDLLTRIAITAGRNCSIDLSGIRILNSHLHVHMVDDCALDLRRDQLMNGAVRLFMHEPSVITAGSDCLWAQGDAWTSDMHSVLDLQTRTRTNPSGDIVIGDHVWLGHDFLLLGETRIGAGSVVAARSVVTGKSFPPNSLVAGTPARVVRSDITWDSRLL